MGLTFCANILLTLAALLTICLGIFFCFPLPAGPDRAILGFACFFLQTPRWICLAAVLGICVAKGAFTWPADRGAQFLVVFIAHAALGFGAIRAGLAALDVTSGILDWLSRILALSTVVVPLMQIGFAVWFLNPGLHKTLDAAGLRNMTNNALAVFAVLVGGFALAGVAAWLLTTMDSRRARAEYEAVEKARQNAKQEAEDRQFQALTPESSLGDWMAFLEYPNSDEHRRVARDAILKRPTLAQELSAHVASTDAKTSIEAMHFVGKMCPAPAGVAEAVRRQARFVTSVAETIDPTSPGSRDVLYERVFGLADGVMSAAHGLYRAGVDIRPELRAMAQACGPRERPPRDIKAGCEQIIQYFDQLEGAPCTKQR
jgi:hypothetical protein